MIGLALLLVAVVPISHPGVPKGPLKKLERAVTEAVSIREPTVPSREVRRRLDVELVALLGREIEMAWEAYYRFEWGLAARLLTGRSDPEALVLRSLVAWAEGSEDLARRLLARLARLKPDQRLDPSLYPPRFVSVLQEVRRQVPRGEKPRLSQIRPGILLDDEDLTPWSTRLVAVGKEAGWDRVVAVGIQPVGWQYRVFRLGSDPGGLGWSEIRIEDLKALPQAAKILMRE